MTTAGLADVRPFRPAARLPGILVALHGIVLTGTIVPAAGIAIERCGELQRFRQLSQSLPRQENRVP